MRFDGINRGGTGITMDTDPTHGGDETGPTPMESLLMALAGCTGMDVMPILHKMRAPVDSLTIGVSAKRAMDHPKVFTDIHLRYVATGRGLQHGQLQRAVRLSQEKYCSVAAMLRKAATITYEVSIEQPAQDKGRTV
jgi:putative redox protein